MLQEVHDAAMVHETHRGRIFSNPWVTRRLICQLPELKLVADYSHFTVTVELSLARTCRHRQATEMPLSHFSMPLCRAEAACKSPVPLNQANLLPASHGCLGIAL
jgi:hypothetical protein